MNQIWSLELLLSTILLTIVPSCSNREKIGSETIGIEKSELETKFSDEFSELYDSVEFIPLETQDSSLFASISQAIITDDAIFVRATFSDDSAEARILQFGKDGSFVQQIGSIGEGPGEYMSIDQMVIVKDTIYAFDEWNLCSHAYSACDGKYLFSTDRDGYDALQGMNTAIWNPVDKDFLFTSDIKFGDDRYSLGRGNPITNQFEKILEPKFNVTGWISYGYGYPTLCNLNSDYALYILPLDNVIYSYEYKTGNIQTAFQLFPEEEKPQFEPMENYETARQKAVEKNWLWPTSLFASKDYLIVSLVSGSIIWNMFDNRGYYTLNGWKKGSTEFPFFPPYIVGVESNENAFVCAYDSSDLLEYCEDIPVSSKFRPSEELLSTLAEDSNQVLVIFKLK